MNTFKPYLWVSGIPSAILAFFRLIRPMPVSGLWHQLFSLPWPSGPKYHSSESHPVMAQPKLATQSLSTYCIIFFEIFAEHSPPSDTILFSYLFNVWFLPLEYLFLFCSPVKQYLAHSRYSTNMCWVNKWTTLWAKSFVLKRKGTLYLDMKKPRLRKAGQGAEAQSF